MIEVKQDVHCTYNVTLSAFVQTLLQGRNNKHYVLWVCVCVCSLRYPTCNVHAPYYHLWPAPLCNIFSHYLINGTVFEKKFPGNKMCVLIVSTTFCDPHFILRINYRRIIKNVPGSPYKVPFILVRFQRILNFLDRFSKKNSLISILFLSFRRVLNVIYSFLGNSPASEL